MKSADKVTIPFEFKQGFIIVKIKMENILPLEFIFDTGAEHTILFKRQYTDIMGIEYSKRIKIIGSDLSQQLFALIARGVKLKLSNLKTVKRDIVVLEDNISLLDEAMGFDVDGILGGSFFRGLVIKIDYKKKKISLYRPDKYYPPKDDELIEFDVDIIKNKPYLKTITNLTDKNQVETNLLVDTGAGLTYLLHANSDSLLKIPDYSIKGSVGYGISGPIEGYLGKIPRLDIGPFYFKNILTSFQDVDSVAINKSDIRRNGILGNKLLSRFEVTIDYLRHKMYLKARKKYNEGFEYDKSGLVIFALGKNLNEFYVKDVLPESPAAEADFRKGDIIKKINCFKSKYWSLEKLNRVLQKKEGKRIKMIIERNGEKIKKKFYLKDFYNIIAKPL